MRISAICLLAGLSSIPCFSQKSPVKFGEIPMEDMKMTTYAKDSSAEAVILVDYGEAHITEMGSNLSLTYTRHVRIKVLKKPGLSWADVSIPLYHVGATEERVSGLKASTYNLENGQIVTSNLSKDGIFKEKFNRNFNQQKFTMPNAKDGSVIEYTYKINSEFFTNFPNWQFQKDIPVRWSEYWAVIPTVLIYEKYMQGYVLSSSYEVKHSGSDIDAHHWIMKDVPAFKPEPFMTCKDDYVSRVNFALSMISVPGESPRDIMGSWEKLNQLLLEDDDFGRVIEKSGFLKSKTEEITAGISDPLKKMAALHRYVSQNIEWDGVKDYYAGNLKKILEEKKGTSGDINLILGSMLDKAGFEVDMVMLSTRDHGFVRKEYPMTKQFNYVICAVKVGDKTMLLDATEKYLPLGVLPERCLNGQGLVISKRNHGWVDVVSKTKSKTLVNGDFALDAQGELKGKLAYTHDGYDAWDMRDEYYTKGETSYTSEFLSGKPWSVGKTEYADLKELDKPVKQTHEIVISEHASVTGDVIYINPFVVSQLMENPFKLEERVYPVSYPSPVERIYMCKIAFPDNYKVDELPQSKIISLPGNSGRYIYNASLIGNAIVFTSNFQINKSLFLQEEYPFLKEFYNQVLAKQAEQIVLKKK